MSRSFPREVTLGELAERFGGRLEGAPPDRTVAGLASLAGAGAGDLSFLSAARHREQAAASAAGAIVTTDALAPAVPPSAARLIVDDPYAHFARIARWLVEERDARRETASVSPAAHIHPSATLAAGVRVGPGAVVDAGARIGAGASLGAGVYVGRDAAVGEASVLHPNVTVYDACEIGRRCIVHSGTVIGSDGFGFARESGRWAKIPQIGRVRIGDDVEIGSNCSIDRGALDDTVIGDGVKLDNLIQIAHNVRIGEHSALAGCVGVAGSAVIGRRCQIGGSAGILGHLEICDDVVVSAMSLVSRSITKPGFYSGIFPLMTNAAWEKAAANVRQLPALRERLRRLERTLPAGSADAPGHHEEPQ